MFEMLYLAECSKTYRRWIPQLLRPYVHATADLWENPQMPLQIDSASRLLMVDEAFLTRGPGPVSLLLRSLLDERKIVALPIILLERRQKPVNLKLSSRIFRLRRPFYAKELEFIFQQLGIHPSYSDEVTMVKKENTVVLDEATVQKITQETIEKMVRELVPSLAEKIIREEIKRLTE